LTAAIFLATFAVLAAGRAPLVRIDRTGAAIVGAVLMVVTGAISFPDAVRAVDFPTLVLLFGMMIIVAHLRLAGGIALVARAIGGGVPSRLRLLFALVCAAGLLSALFVNDTICLVFTPVVLDLAAARRERPLPYLLALATASNIGSVATMTGNPQNMLIGSVSGISFARFASALTPVAMVGLAIDGAIIWALFRRELAGDSTALAELPRARTHRPLLIKTLVVIAGVLGALLAGFDSALVAVSGAAALLITRRVSPRKIYAAIDWDLLVLFAGLFVVVGAGERAGFDRRLLEWLRPLGVQTVAGLSATAAVLSNAISNVPAVMLFTRIVPRLPHPERAWLALAMSSTLAGNLTVLGSIANLIVIEGARRRGVTVSFTEYARVGVPLTVITILFGILWLSWRV
jgi:Na+/H+ antiporter NhaD/arsenite permease-like protein